MPKIEDDINPYLDLSIYLNENPMQCDCNIYNFLEYLNKSPREALKTRFKLYIGNLTCDGEYNGSSVKNLNFTSYKCVSERINYPSDTACGVKGNCTCRFRPFDKSLIIDCSSRNLMEVPELITLKGIDRIELNLKSNNIKKMPNMKKPGYNQIEMLDLSNNQISDVSDNILHGHLKVTNEKTNKIEFF